MRNIYCDTHIINIAKEKKMLHNNSIMVYNSENKPSVLINLRLTNALIFDDGVVCVSNSDTDAQIEIPFEPKEAERFMELCYEKMSQK
jgi:hypothetical protein